MKNHLIFHRHLDIAFGSEPEYCELVFEGSFVPPNVIELDGEMFRLPVTYSHTDGTQETHYTNLDKR